MDDASAKRVDLDALWQSVAGHVPFDEREQFREAIAEIEAARAAPAPSPSFSSGSPPAIVAAALAGLRDLAVAVVQEVRREREAGPPRAARLVAYRCVVAPRISGVNWPEQIEKAAHAMLAAERPAE